MKTIIQLQQWKGWDKYIRYTRTKARELWVRKDLKGKNKDYMLCVKCKNVNIGCYKFAKQKELQKRLNLTMVVWECPNFILEGGKLHEAKITQ